MFLLTFLLAMGCTLALPAINLRQLERDGATDTFAYDMRKMTAAAGVGALLGVAATLGTDLPPHTRFITVVLLSLFALGAWIDRVSAWAPDTIIVPICFLTFLIDPEIADFRDFLALTLFGFTLFLAALSSWYPQEMLGFRFITPPDVVALAVPFFLFGISYELVAVYLSISVLMLISLKSKRIALVFSNPEALRDAKKDTEYDDKEAIAFLAVIFPVLIGVMLWNNLQNYF